MILVLPLKSPRRIPMIVVKLRPITLTVGFRSVETTFTITRLKTAVQPIWAISTARYLLIVAPLGIGRVMRLLRG